MKRAKQSVGRIFVVAEVIIFLGFYIWGANGLSALSHLKNDIESQAALVMQLRAEVSQLESMITTQMQHPFFQEKIAREQLQMARANEEIYLID